MKRRTFSLIAAAMGFGFVCAPILMALAGEAAETKVTLESLPEAARQSILKECGNNKLKDIEATTNEGETVYEADWIVNGKEVEVKVAVDGRTLGKDEEEAHDDADEHGEREQGHRKSGESAQWTDSFELGDCTFASIGKNKYFVLEPGFQLVLEDSGGNRIEKLEITVLDETRMIGSVETRVVEERETVNGEVKEVSRNFFAFCKENSSVFYFGEETDNYNSGKVSRGNDSWSADTGDAKPGLIMPGLVLVGAKYYQELAPGKAMDRAEIVSLNDTLDTPAGRFEHCLKTQEGSALEPGEKEYKVYAPGIGLIRDEDLLLTHHGFVGK